MKKSIQEQVVRLGGIKRIKRQFVQPTEEEIVFIETHLGVRLPEDYREYLLMNGASTLGKIVGFKTLNSSPLYVGPDTDPPRHKAGSLNQFYGSSGGELNLMYNIDVYKDRMPETMIPIADDGIGNQICLGIKGNELNKVFYWEHEYEWGEQEYLEDYGKPMPPEVKFQNVYLIANSFEEFILKLEIAPDN